MKNYLFTFIVIISISCQIDDLNETSVEQKSAANNDYSQFHSCDSLTFVGHHATSTTTCDPDVRELYYKRFIGFENQGITPYDEEKFKCDFGNSFHSFNGEGRTTLITSGGADVLKVKFPKNTWGPVNSGVYGNSWIPAFNEYFLYYRVWFDDGFDFTAGMKLPGFCGGMCNTGGSQVTEETDGWSFRLMAYANPNDSTIGDVRPYGYHRGMSQPYGGNFGLRADSALQTNQWHGIQIHVKMEDPCNDMNDGIFEVWIDDELKFSNYNVNWRTGTSRIDRVLFHSWPGGNDASYAPEEDQFLRFGEIKWWSCY